MRRLTSGLECKLIVIFYVGIVHTNLYSYNYKPIIYVLVDRVLDRMQYLEVFDHASHACG